MLNKQLVINYYKNGETLEVVGKKFNVSRQRIHQIITKSNIKREIITNSHQTKNLTTHKLPSLSEKWVANKLISLGHIAEFTGYNNEYDLLIDNKFKIEIKHRTKSYIKNNNYYYQINLYKKIFDFLIIIVGELDNPTCYILPSSIKNYYFSVPVNPIFDTTFQRMYKEAWNQI